MRRIIDATQSQDKRLMTEMRRAEKWLKMIVFNLLGEQVPRYDVARRETKPNMKGIWLRQRKGLQPRERGLDDVIQAWHPQFRTGLLVDIPNPDLMHLIGREDLDRMVIANQIRGRDLAKDAHVGRFQWEGQARHQQRRLV